VDPRRTPLVLGGHPADEIAHFARHHGSAAPHAASRETLPVEPEPARCQPTTVSGFTMTRTSAQRDQTRQRAIQEDTIGGLDAAPVPLDHRGDLLPKGDVLEQEVPPRTAD
jgi:hypothetical protein